jgi:hypothetical protein
VLLDAFHEILKFSFPKPTHTIALIDWTIGMAGYVGLLCAFATIIIFGIRDIRKKGYDTQRIFVPAIVVLVVLFKIVSFTSHYSKTDYLIGFSPLNVSPAEATHLAEIIKNEDRPIESRAYASRLYAEWKFQENGSLVQQLMPDGTTRLFSPTVKDIEMRESVLETRTIFENIDNFIPYVMTLWMIVLCAGLLLGFLTPIKKTAPPTV